MNLRPEAALWLAVIERAAGDVLNPEDTGASFDEQCSALDWINSDNCAPASYLWACMTAGVRPSVVRDLLRERGL